MPALKSNYNLSIWQWIGVASLSAHFFSSFLLCRIQGTKKICYCGNHNRKHNTCRREGPYATQLPSHSAWICRRYKQGRHLFLSIIVYTKVHSCSQPFFVILDKLKCSKSKNFGERIRQGKKHTKVQLIDKAQFTIRGRAGIKRRNQRTKLIWLSKSCI